MIIIIGLIAYITEYPIGSIPLFVPLCGEFWANFRVWFMSNIGFSTLVAFTIHVVNSYEPNANEYHNPSGDFSLPGWDSMGFHGFTAKICSFFLEHVTWNILKNNSGKRLFCSDFTKDNHKISQAASQAIQNRFKTVGSCSWSKQDPYGEQNPQFCSPPNRRQMFHDDPSIAS